MSIPFDSATSETWHSIYLRALEKNTSKITEKTLRVVMIEQIRLYIRKGYSVSTVLLLKLVKVSGGEAVRIGQWQ